MALPDLYAHQLAASGSLEPLGSRFVGFDLWHV